MDPELWELFETGSPEDIVSVIIRMDTRIEPPPAIRIVSRFGDIYTARVRRDEIVAIRQRPGVISLKAASLVTMPARNEAVAEGEDDDVAGDQSEYENGDRDDEFDEDIDGEAMKQINGLSRVTETGKGVVLGICDWGLDFTSPAFRNVDGSTRLECIWDQRGFGSPLAPEPYRQGRLLTREAINAALADADPFAALDYYPSDADPTGTGSHGTHVADIAAGNRREPGSEVGLASEADLVFVHLAPTKVGELGSLGDSISLLEGLDFVRRTAAGRPCVLHLSAGKTLGPKRGTTLLERAVDTALQQPGIVLVQSVGNYASAAMHSHARIGPDQRHEFVWITPDNDRTPNELELWYSGQDVFNVKLISPTGREFSVPLGERVQLTDDGTVWGNFYHRLQEPNSGLNHIVIFLYTPAPSGRWRVVMHGMDIVDGRVHAWIERDASGRYQSRFAPGQATSGFTTNTICNCFRAIAVGAYDATKPNRPGTLFSSRGPTADGRQKPEIAAPGYRIRAARSTPKNGWRPGDKRLCVKSGTSMAAPWVSGTVALMFSAAGRPLSIHEIRRVLIGTSDPHAGPSGRSSSQLGYGYLNIPAAVDAARKLGQAPPAQLPVSRARRAEAAALAREGEPEWVPVEYAPAREGEPEWVPAEYALAREGEPEWVPIEDEVTPVDADVAWAPTWVEDAAVGEVPDEVLMLEEAEPETLTEALSESEVHAPCNCGCAHCQETMASGEEDEEQDQEEEDIDDDSPFALEDIREALEAYDTGD